MSRLLVTGGAGFIGSNFVRYWHERRPDDGIVVLDSLTYAGCRENLDGLEGEEVRFVEGDILDRAAVEDLLAREGCDTVVHFAAESHVDRSIAGPARFVEVNVSGTQSLLDAARTVWLEGEDVRPHRFHHVSTDEVYGSLGPEDAPFSETTPYDPTSPYAASKASADHLVRAYHRTYGLAVTLSNCSNNYGPYHFPEKLIPLCIVNLLEGRPLPIYGDGSNVRDWLHVRDHCAGIEAVLDRGVPGETYNIGGRAERTNLEVVTGLCRAVDDQFATQPHLRDRFPKALPARGQMSESSVHFVRDRPGHDRRYAIDPFKIESELGFTPEVRFEMGLAETVRWFLENESWWRSILARPSYEEWVGGQYGGE